MNFFEQELRKLFAKNHAFDDVKFIGNVCYGILGEKTRMKLEFVILDTHQQYEGIRATVLDKTDGKIDSLTLKFTDIWGRKKLNHPNFKEGMHPHIWIYNGTAEWYAYQPTPADYKEIADSICDYAKLFKEQVQEMKNGYSMAQQM